MAQAIRRAIEPEDIDAVRSLFREYSDSLGIDLSFQDFPQELAGLPGRYGPPSGCLLLATVDGGAAGCVGLRRLADGVCEMKRLYVRLRHRGTGLGRRLAERVVWEARALGYQRVRLDTIPSLMGRAVELYRSLGFTEIDPYRDNPVEGAVFMELRLGE